jgi:hypothetical protein
MPVAGNMRIRSPGALSPHSRPIAARSRGRPRINAGHAAVFGKILRLTCQDVSYQGVLPRIEYRLFEPHMTLSFRSNLHRATLPSLVASAFFVLLSIGAPEPVRSQPNPDWQMLWQHLPDTTHMHPFYWMGIRKYNYTGLAYDRFRDKLYIVHPEMCVGMFGIPYGCATIHIVNPTTGQMDSSIGRSRSGSGGELPVPLDTVNGGFERGRFLIYKIDLDDEGRIYACNLVAPIWNPPDPPCWPDPFNQGPWRVYRWDTPSSTPRCIYSTLNGTSDSVGWSRYNSEMTWSRWGDSFDVVGKRSYRNMGPGIPPALVDSVRIFASGGPFCNQVETNREVNVFLSDERPNAPCEFRLGIRLISSLMGIASHGIAATGTLPGSPIWMDNNTGVTTLNNQFQPSTPWPINWTMTSQFALSGDSLTGTGQSGPIAYFRIGEVNRNYLVCADGRPTDPFDTSAMNRNTTARIVDVSSPTQAFRRGSVTPMIGFKPQEYLDEFDGNNYVADVDYKLERDSLQRGYYITLFVLMSNNGIAAFRSKWPLIVPVEMLAFDARAEERDVRLRWITSAETNNRGFEIERSFNLGAAWERIGFVEGRGTTATNHEYQYADPILSTHRSVGEVQYRLRQVDFDGTATYSSVASVAFPGASSPLLAQNYPNPFSDATTIRYALPAEAHVRLSVANALGETVRILADETQSAGMHAMDFDATRLAPGMYVCRLDAGGTTLQKRMLLRR